MFNKKLYVFTLFMTALAFLILDHPYLGLAWLAIALMSLFFFAKEIFSNDNKKVKR